MVFKSPREMISVAVTDLFRNFMDAQSGVLQEFLCFLYAYLGQISGKGQPHPFFKQLAEIRVVHGYPICHLLVDHWLSSQTLPDVVPIEVNEELLSLWRRLIYEKRNLHENNAEIIICCAKLLCLTLERSIAKTLSADGRKEHFIAYKLKQYIEKHATEPLTLDKLAARNGVSSSTASHLFKLAFGLPPIRYAVEVRLAIACDRILYSDMRLEDAAEASGFRSYPYFCRAFRSKYGHSPSEYRSQYRNV
ncbi:AraC family transcriptional regulator [Paenibacillus sp. HWE-109]|nr:AraC family transcriptional regulator [Paenibacillus sp. HWE-109]UKS29459.1 AraC family transcriptional regulator [Paenibacillus sp. HWE-109]